jgi:type IV secretory pathway VirB2 component (pilin)
MKNSALLDRCVVGAGAWLLWMQPLAAYAQAQVFTQITDKFVALLTGPLARGLGLIAMASCILLFMFGEGGRVFKTVLAVVFSIAALINLVALYDSIIGGGA